MKIAVVGSRTFNNYPYMCVCINDAISKLGNPEISVMVSGGAKGADTLAEQYAQEIKVPTSIFLADWETYGKSAGYIRNKEIVDNSDVVIAFWDGKSEGTQHTINIAKEQRKPCFIYTKW